MFQRLATAVCVGAIVAACSGGPGSPIDPGPSTDRAATGPEGSGGGVEGAATSGDPGRCLPCSGYYQCVGSIAGQDISGGSTLPSADPSCAGKKDDNLYFGCGGAIVTGTDSTSVPPGSTVGSWTQGADGTVVACVRVSGVDDCITCTPATQPVSPGSNNSDAGTRKSDAGVSGDDAGFSDSDGG